MIPSLIMELFACLGGIKEVSVENRCTAQTYSLHSCSDFCTSLQVHSMRARVTGTSSDTIVSVSEHKLLLSSLNIEFIIFVGG